MFTGFKFSNEVPFSLYRRNLYESSSYHVFHKLKGHLKPQLSEFPSEKSVARYRNLQRVICLILGSESLLFLLRKEVPLGKYPPRLVRQVEWSTGEIASCELNSL